MVAHADDSFTRMHPDVVVQVIDAGAHHEFTLTSQVPRSDLEVIASILPTLVDTDGDGVKDHHFTTELSYDDVNGNGLVDRGVDRMRLTHTNAKVIQRGVRLCCTPAELWQVTESVVSRLGGVMTVERSSL